MARYLKKSAFLASVLLLLVSVCAVGFMPASKASAVANSDFNAARIIDDSVFYNPNTMSTDEIQAFLNSKVPVCETSHAPGTFNGITYNPPFICLKDFSMVTDAMPADSYCSALSSASESAATIIKTVSAACSINPQVLLILLQKEQGLITDTWPLPTQYAKATGYACPDSAPCDPAYAGFFKQVYYGARQYQRYAKQPQMYNFRAGQASAIQYNPDTGCGSSVVTIQNQATAGLYNYTPYQPNASVLGSAHGTTVTCGAYGNINFWWQYWAWFGNPIGSPYAWLIDSFSYSGGDNILTKDYAETLTLRAKNVGRSPWYRGGPNPVRLGTWQPADHGSPLLGGGIRYTTLTESVVQPNDIGTFTFTVTPSQTGTFVEPMNLVVENSQWMSWPGFSPTIVVAPSPYQYSVENVIYSSGGGIMEPGTTQDMTMIVRNTGNITWSKTSGPPIWLATWGPGRSSEVGVAEPGKWPSATRITMMNESSVAPGQTAGFQFKVSVPRQGNFYEQLNLVAEGQDWFGGPMPILYLNGGDFAWQPISVTHSTGTANISRGQSFRLTVKARNTGVVTWHQNMKLATAEPQNRSSAFYSDFWLSSSRTASLQETSVAPGGIGTFSFIANSPAIPGPYNEHFSLVAEGQEWLNDPGFSIYVNSQ